jgi:hypothetical protein
MITKDHASKIASKLKANIRSGGSHDIAIIEYDGKRIAQFGIRRGSRKDAGHDHIPASIYVNSQSALNLARCPMSYEQWIELMLDKGLIEKKAGKGE